MEEKKKKNIFLKILLILFLIYFSLFLMDNLGYYNLSTKKTILTEEKIKQFESDIKSGKSIDLTDYVEKNTNYNNTYSDIGYNISIGIDKILNDGLNKVGNLLKKLFK